ncbi:hypothetical protein NIES4071_29230 [Calothrix sp. NIES-4071]|nr:hypothetical protein NIES4071_29230 [Calothrix sp. NIES-4071]BAZ57243.1 hypothetical protein NIES4105_29170 [Calothrix sp. NIES-4105]
MTKSTAGNYVPQFPLSQEATIGILRTLGYGLLLLALFDWVEILVPPQFMNPNWEFQTIGALVERVPVPLIGFALIFYGESQARSRWEVPIIKLLSWLTLLLAVVYFLMIPLAVIDAGRISQQRTEQIKSASTQQIARAQQLQEQLSQATPQQIDNFLKQQGAAAEGKNAEQVKEELTSRLSQAKVKIKNQAKTTQSTQEFNLTKSLVKWSLGALVAGSLFFSIWKGTRWTSHI